MAIPVAPQLQTKHAHYKDLHLKTSPSVPAMDGIGAWMTVRTPAGHRCAGTYSAKSRARRCAPVQPQCDRCRPLRAGERGSRERSPDYGLNRLTKVEPRAF